MDLVSATVAAGVDRSCARDPAPRIARKLCSRSGAGERSRPWRALGFPAAIRGREARSPSSTRSRALGSGLGYRGALIPSNQLGLAALGERQLDRVEVTWNDGPLEQFARLVADHGWRMAGGDVVERQHRHLGLPRDRRRLLGGGVTVFEGAVRF